MLRFGTVMYQKFLYLLLVFFASKATSQVSLGLKGGASMILAHVDPIQLFDETQSPDYTIALKSPGLGWNGGAFLQIKAGNFFIQPEAIYSFHISKYELTNHPATSTPAQIKESIQQMDFLMLTGFTASVLRIGVGPVLHMDLKSQPGFSDVLDFSESIEKFRWGLQAGIGLDLWKVHIDVRYETNFDNLGSHFRYKGEQVDFGIKENRILASLGFSF